MAGGDAYTLPGQMDSNGAGATAESPAADEVALLPPLLRTSVGGHPASNVVHPLPPPEPEEDLTGCQVHARGIGVDGWDGTPDGVGQYENLGAMNRIFSPFGEFKQATIRHRIEGDQNTSWALVTMANPQSVDSILRAHEEAPIYAGSSRLVLTRFDRKTAKNSTGGMLAVQTQDDEERAWPEWLKQARAEHLKMHVDELRSMHDTFEKHAVVGLDGMPVM